MPQGALDFQYDILKYKETKLEIIKHEIIMWISKIKHE